jgi:AraC-like DNA-binding protein
VQAAPTSTFTPVDVAAVSVSSLCHEIESGKTFTVEIPSMDAYFVMIYRQDVRHCDILEGKQYTQVRNYSRGSACLVDLTDGAAIMLHSSLDSLGIVLPKVLFSEVCRNHPLTWVGGLKCERGKPDSVIASLGKVLSSALIENSISSQIILPHIAIALCAHLIHHYTNPSLRNGVGVSSLSLWQEKTAKEFMVGNLENQISVSAVANAAGMSTTHFSQEFKKATGDTPHRWLTRFRIEHAMRLLETRSFSISAVAIRCGYVDQSHFTKVFAAYTGATPFAWLQAKSH